MILSLWRCKKCEREHCYRDSELKDDKVIHLGCDDKDHCECGEHENKFKRLRTYFCNDSKLVIWNDLHF